MNNSVLLEQYLYSLNIHHLCVIHYLRSYIMTITQIVIRVILDIKNNTDNTTLSA